MLSIFTNQRILVTGAYGFVGSHLMYALNHATENLFAIVHNADFVRQVYAPTNDWPLQVRTIQADIRNYEQIERAITIAEPDYIFHLAAITQVTEAAQVPRQTWDTNVMGTVNLLEATKRIAPNAKIIIASSDKAYGKQDRSEMAHGGLRETLIPNPGHPYDTSKAAADLAAQSYANHYKLSITIARMANIFGPGDLNFKRLIPETIRDILHDRSPQIRSDGMPVREYINVEAAIHAYLLLANSLHEQLPNIDTAEIYNFGGLWWTVGDLVKQLLSLMKREDLQLQILNTAKGESSRIIIRDDKAKKDLGWIRPDNSGLFTKNLLNTIAWYESYFRSK
ncbi:hypothetical protein LCGC14_0508770 [marine sediment metagenome]|uniref:NAD-dependent epimerase/dehydratase domain-containing protein n=1 Tax=marine sediment metagenome TaxID=412755 RepID=A0A0F9VA96_9ZZZZ